MPEEFIKDKSNIVFVEKVRVKRTYKDFVPAVNVETYVDLKNSQVTIVFDRLVLDSRGLPTSASRPEAFRHCTPQQAVRVAGAIMQAVLVAVGSHKNNIREAQQRLAEAMKSL